MATRKKVRDGEEFVFCTGARAATVAQCRKELGKLNAEEFAHHVNDARHDVYDWIRDCLDAKLAQKIESVRDQQGLADALK